MRALQKILILILIFVIVGATITFISKKIHNIPEQQTSQQTPQQTSTGFDAKNSTFTIDDEPITLVDGISKTSSAPGSASMNITQYFGNEAYGDLNGDGLSDTAFLVTRTTGGTGTFYYVVVALKTPTGYKTTNAFFIGDRIAPQSTEIHSDSRELHVNFAERKDGEPMTAQPSVGAVLLLKVTPDGVLEGLME